eukprot:gene28546-37504_t
MFSVPDKNIAGDEMNNGLMTEESPLFACKSMMEWTNGVINTLILILREIPPFRSGSAGVGGSIFQPPINDRNHYDHLLDLIQSSLQEIISRYNGEAKVSLLLIKKYLELQSQFQYSQSNLLQILTKQQIMYNRQLDALCASYQSSQYSINLSPFPLNVIPPTGDFESMSNSNVLNSANFLSGRFNPQNSALGGGRNFLAGNSGDASSSTEASEHLVDGLFGHMSSSNAFMGSQHQRSLLRPTSSSANSSKPNYISNFSINPSNFNSSISGGNKAASKINFSGINSDNTTNTSPPNLAGSSNVNTGQLLVQAQAQASKSSVTAGSTTSSVPQVVVDLSGDSNNMANNTGEQSDSDRPQHAQGDMTLNLNDILMSRSGPQNIPFQGGMAIPLTQHVNYFNRQGTFLPAGTGPPNIVNIMPEISKKEKKAGKKSSEQKGPTTASISTPSVPTAASSASVSAHPPILLRKSNRGMLAINKPDPNASSSVQWYFDAPKKLNQDNSLSAAEQLKLLKAEKIKNELNKKIASMPEELEGSLGSAIIPLPKPIIFKGNGPLPSSLKSILDSNEPRKRSFAALTADCVNDADDDDDEDEEEDDDDVDEDHKNNSSSNPMNNYQQQLMGQVDAVSSSSVITG